jgi:putative membrane protein
MISYNPKDWFTFVFKIHKTETMQKLIPLLFGVGIYAGLWAYFETIYLAKNISKYWDHLLYFGIYPLFVFGIQNQYGL